MTAATFARLPLAAGGAVLELTGNAIHWGFARYMRAPLANTGILAMVTFTAMAASNALYLQQHEHPAPLFSAGGIRQAVARVEPVIPAVRQKKPKALAPLQIEETTGSVAPKQASPIPIGNTEVAEIQRKLTSMQIFDGAVDGLYGPRTARAIKTFETRMGMTPKGELTWALLEAVRATPVILPEQKIELLPTPDPLPQATVPNLTTPQAEAAPVSETPEPVAEATEFRAIAAQPTGVTELAPLPEPAPLVVEVAAASAKKPVLTRELPATPEEAFEIAAETAEDALETIIDGVQTIAMTKPGKKQPAAEVQQLKAQSATVAPTTAIGGAPATEALPAAAEATILETASIEAPQVGVPLAMPEDVVAKSSDDVAVLEGEAKPEELMPAFSVTDPIIVAKVQRGLGSLGFLHGPADGVAGEATAKAIRNFEVYYNYKVTGRISPELLDLLVQNGASI